MKVNKKFIAFIIASIVAICSCATKFYFSDNSNDIKFEVESKK